MSRNASMARATGRGEPVPTISQDLLSLAGTGETQFAKLGMSIDDNGGGLRTTPGIAIRRMWHMSCLVDGGSDKRMRNLRSSFAIIYLLMASQAWGEYREIVVTDGATISGDVHLSGKPPTLPEQPVYKHQDTCGTSQRDQRLMLGKNGELGDAIVYLADITAGKAARIDSPLKLDNKNCSFVPHVATATVGQTLDIHNSDPFLHDAHAWLGAETLFNVAIMKDHSVQKPLLKPGLIHINCNIRHTWMHSYLLVAEHPYHAVTSADGHFQLDNVPPGTWTLRVWHELLGSSDTQVKVQSGETQKVTVNLQSTAAEAQ